MSRVSSTPAPDWGQQRDFYTFAPETLGQELPEFRIIREVGKGSMGIVYEARVRSSGDHIALKVLPPSLTLTERALARFAEQQSFLYGLLAIGISLLMGWAAGRLFALD